MLSQVFDGGFVSLIDLDLLYARIALDLKEAIAFSQVVVQFLRAANIENGIGIAIELANFLQTKPGGRGVWKEARTKTPALLESKFAGQTC